MKKISIKEYYDGLGINAFISKIQRKYGLVDQIKFFDTYALVIL